VATLTLNRPESLNALSDEMLHALGDALYRLDKDPDVAVIALTGAGRAFCAGGDVKQMQGKTSTLTYEQRVAELRWKRGQHDAAVDAATTGRALVDKLPALTAERAALDRWLATHHRQVALCPNDPARARRACGTGAPASSHAARLKSGSRRPAFGAGERHHDVAFERAAVT
jgi:hypothetical protein